MLFTTTLSTRNAPIAYPLKLDSKFDYSTDQKCKRIRFAIYLHKQKF